MTTAHLYFDSTHEIAVIQRPGCPDQLRHLRDERQAAQFASEMGYVVAGSWTMLSYAEQFPCWEHADLLAAA